MKHHYVTDLDKISNSHILLRWIFTNFDRNTWGYKVDRESYLVQYCTVCDTDRTPGLLLPIGDDFELSMEWIGNAKC